MGDLRELPEGSVEIGRIQLITFLNADGDTLFRYQHDDGISGWEAIGLMTVYINEIVADLCTRIEPIDDE